MYERYDFVCWRILSNYCMGVEDHAKFSDMGVETSQIAAVIWFETCSQLRCFVKSSIFWMVATLTF